MKGASVKVAILSFSSQLAMKSLHTKNQLSMGQTIIFRHQVFELFQLLGRISKGTLINFLSHFLGGTVKNHHVFANYFLKVRKRFYLFLKKHHKDCEWCPCLYLIANHYSSMSWFKFHNYNNYNNHNNSQLCR